MTFNWVDWLFIVIIAISAVMSLLRGFIREALSLLTWIAAGIITWLFAGDLAEQLIHLDVELFKLFHVRLITACILLFMFTLVVGALVNHLIYRLIALTDASSMDKFLGMVFGAARGAILVLFMVGLINITALTHASWWQQSVLQGEFAKVALWSQKFIIDLAQ